MKLIFFTDIDECTDISKNNCSLNANCTDTIGSYDCTCQIGYSGNGYICDGRHIMTGPFSSVGTPVYQPFTSQIVLFCFF